MFVFFGSVVCVISSPFCRPVPGLVDPPWRRRRPDSVVYLRSRSHLFPPFNCFSFRLFGTNTDHVTLNDNMRRLRLSAGEDICTTWWSFLSEYQSCNWAQAEQTWRARRRKWALLSSPPSIPFSLSLFLSLSLLSVSSCTHTNTVSSYLSQTHAHVRAHDSSSPSVNVHSSWSECICVCHPPIS